ncbi:MAG: type II toxin-antitoxin system HicB family antitoxin [bacterium]
MDDLTYPVVLTEDEADGGFVATFPDLPEAITQGEYLDDARGAEPERDGRAQRIGGAHRIEILNASNYLRDSILDSPQAKLLNLPTVGTA